PVAPSSSLSVSGWIKATGVSTASGDGARVVLIERDAAGTQVAATDLSAAMTGTSATWQMFSKTVTTRATTATLDVQVVLDGSGAANFDDIVVNAATPTPISTPTLTSTPTPRAG